MGDATKHRKLGSLSNVELMTHPWEEVGQAMVSTFDSLGYPGTPTRKRQSGNTIWAKKDLWITLPHEVLGQEDI